MHLWRVWSHFGAVTANTWQHIAVTPKAALKTIRSHIDGIAAGGDSYATPSITSPVAVSIRMQRSPCVAGAFRCSDGCRTPTHVGTGPSGARGHQQGS